MGPCLRKDLVATIADEQGVSCVEVTDPLTSISFRFYDFEYALAQQLTGQPLEAVVSWALATYGVDLSAETLEQFIEKLAGLGFLVGGSSGAQPAILVPSSASSGSQPFGELPTTVVVGVPPLVDSPPFDAFEDSPREPTFVHAAAPEGLISGDATEYRLKEGGSGLWEQGRDRGEVRAEVRAEVRNEAPLVSREPEAAMPRLEILAGPLPPVADDPKSPVAREQTVAAPLPASWQEISTSAETPLASITQVIDAEFSGPAPSGALDAATPSAPVETVPAGDVWATDLAQQVDHPRAERRQPPRPELVVMPPVAESRTAPPPPRRRFTALFVLLLLAGAVAAAAWFLRLRADPQGPVSSSDPPTVHVVSPQPTTFYRWFATVGVVVPGRDDTLGFPTGGRLQDAMPPGTTFRAGETIARLAGVAARELTVNRVRSRVSFYEQLRDSSRAEGAETATQQAAAKLAARRQELAAAQAALSALEIQPKVAGEIAELLVAKGGFVRAGAPVFRVRATGPRATFSLASEDVARARALVFCRVETIPGSGGGADAGSAENSARAIDCTLSAAAQGDQAGVTVDLLGATAPAAGTQVRLASARYEGVFPVPRLALAHRDGTDRLWVVSGGGKVAENRVVEIAATVGDLGLIVHGISVGEAVIIDPPASLADGAEVNLAR